MPSRNIIRLDDPDSYYHVYSRGVDKSDIFIDHEDKEYFLYLFSRHLSDSTKVSQKGYRYPSYKNLLELLCFCIMDNHFHLLVYQSKQGGVTKLMRSVLTAYTRYFNDKHKRRGPLFESRYKASRIDSDRYLLHISRYIHRNPHDWRNYSYSSLDYILNGNEPQWLQTDKICRLFPSSKAYLRFLKEYKGPSSGNLENTES